MRVRVLWLAVITSGFLLIGQSTLFAADQVVVESKTVAPGQTGVELAISLENDLPINAITFPFLVRTVAGEAFWTNVPASLDTLPWYGRATSALTTFRFLNNMPEYLDGISPDQFMIAGQRVSDPPLVAGPLEPVISFVFDVNNSIGQFMIDTGLYPPSNHLIYVDDNTYSAVPLDLTPGIVTIPWGEAEIAIESITVPTSSIGVNLGIKIANDDPLQRVTLPLVCRTLTGGAFWDNAPATVDTLPWTGRLTSALTNTRTLDKSQIDGVSPDPFLIEASNDTDPELAPGSLEEMITLTFDIGPLEGSFEIDTAFFAPNGGLAVETPGSPGVVIEPTFTKGIINTVAPDTGNKVIISSTTVLEGSKDVELPIQIITADPVASLSIPLTARSVSGGAFWEENFDTLPWQMVPPIAISNTREIVEQLNFDFISPDDFLIWAKVFDEPCLDASSQPAYITLTFDINHNPGSFEIDTIMLPPFRTLYFGLCNDLYSIEPEFTKGIVTVDGCVCDMNGDVNCDGAFNPLDAVVIVNFVYEAIGSLCDPGYCPYNGDLNCDGLINPLDVVFMVEFIYKNNNMLCDPCNIHVPE